jgi:hypothetical protein
MEKAIWICIVIDVLAAIILLFISFSSGQDAAGRAMIVLPIILLLVLAGIGYFLLKSNHSGWALSVSGIPAIVVILILLFTVMQGIGSK